MGTPRSRPQLFYGPQFKVWIDNWVKGVVIYL